MEGTQEQSQPPLDDPDSTSPGEHSSPITRPMKRVDSLDEESNRIRGMARSFSTKNLSKRTIALLAFQSIGVIYGDIGTSPLYVYASTYVLNKTDADGNYIPALHEDILGVLCLIIYTLTLVPLIKYCHIVLRANDNGNGGTFALYSLVCRHARINLATNQGPDDRDLSSYQLDLPSRPAKRAAKLKEFLERSRFMRHLLLTVALIGTCCVIGDGVLTPSISVLSAVSGIKVNTPSLSQDVVVGVSVAILVVLFCVQRLGTDKVGYSFALAISIWFTCIALIGVYNIVKFDPTIFKAFNPYYIYTFFKRNKYDGWVSLGGVVLAITGSEAMFADLAHFSVGSIQISCTFFAYPSLLLAYIGQAAWLMKHEDMVSTTFYSSIPKPVYWPMFVVATAAAVIASQAMISAVFSIVDQSMALGCFPRCKVIHTSNKYEGQIYIPEVNWILMLLCVIITASLRDTAKIGNAYGVTVVAVMVITTMMVTLIMVMVWQKPLFFALAFGIFFGAIELLYFSSVLYKIPQYGWIPLAFVAVFSTIMYTWYYTRKEAFKYEVINKLSMNWLLGLGSNLGIVRVPGIALIYTELPQGVPEIFGHLINNLPAMHSTLVLVCVKHLPVPRVPHEERILLRRVGPPAYHMYRCAVRYGYNDSGDNDFETLLMSSLEEFIRAEAAGALDLQLAANGSNENSVLGGSLVTGGANSITSEIDARAQGQIEHLRHARESGIVYVLGHTNLKCKETSSVLRKFVINDLYGFLRRNSRSSSDSLDVPHTNLLQVGMVRYI
jgi:KUP system potassium uptake protein